MPPGRHGQKIALNSLARRLLIEAYLGNPSRKDGPGRVLAGNGLVKSGLLILMGFGPSKLKLLQ